MFWARVRVSCSYQNWSPELSARRINTALLFKIIVIADFKLNGLGCEILKINYERYVMHEAKQTVLNIEITG